MAGALKRYWNRIIIKFDSESSEDEAPPCKISKSQNPQQDTKNIHLEKNLVGCVDTASLEDEGPLCKIYVSQNPQHDTEHVNQEPITVYAPEKASSTQEASAESGDRTDNNDQPVKKKRRTGCAVPCILSNTTTVLYQQVIAKITSVCLNQNASQILQYLSSLSSIPIGGKWTLHCNKSTVHMRNIIWKLLMFIEESARKNLNEVNSLAAIESFISMSGGLLWAFFVIITSLVWSEPYDSVFPNAVGIVIRNIKSQVSALRLSIELLNTSLPVQHDSVKQGLGTVYETIINSALLLNRLVIMKHFRSDDLVSLAIDIGLLPQLGSNAMITQRSLYLVRSVLKEQVVCWEKCTLNIHSAMFQTCHWSEKFSFPFDSGSPLHKCTLLLLTMIQSSIFLPVHWTDYYDENLVQCLRSSGVKSIFKRIVKDDFRDELFLRRNEAYLLKALDKPDLIVHCFFEQVKSDLKRGSLDEHSNRLKGFLEDLLSLTEDYKWPAAEYMLILFSNLMVTSLKEDGLPESSCKFILECLTSILVKFNHLMFPDVEEVYDFPFKAEDPRALHFLQKALLTYSAKDYDSNYISEDTSLFYLSVWHREKHGNTEDQGDDLEESFTVNCDNVRQVVKRIIALRRTSDIKSIFKKVVLLKDTNQKLSLRVMTLVVHVVQMNAELFLDEPLLLTIISSRRNENHCNQRKALVQCLTAFLLLRPDRFDSYFEIFRSYVSDKAATVRKTAIKGMKMIGLKFFDNPKVLKKLLLLLKTDVGYNMSAMQLFCKVTWLEPVKKAGRAHLEVKVSMLINMFALIIDSSWLEEWFPFFFRLDEEGTRRQLQLKASAQIVAKLSTKCLEKRAPHDIKTIASFKLLNLFAKITPDSLVSKYIPLFLSLRRECRIDMPNVELISSATAVLKTVLSCTQNKSPSIYYDIFMDSIKVSRIFNKNTIGYGLENACLVASLQERYTILENSCILSVANISLLDAVWNESPGQLCLVQRQLFMLGVIFKNTLDHSVKPFANCSKDLFLPVLAKCFHSDKDLRQTALFALDAASMFHTETLLEENVKGVFLDVLHTEVPTCVLLQVLMNICELVRDLAEFLGFVTHSSSRRQRALSDAGMDSSQCNDSAIKNTREFLKAFLNTYLEPTFHRYNHPDALVRLAVSELVFIVEQTYALSCKKIIHMFVSMACDPEKSIADRAERWLCKHAMIHAECVLSAITPALTMICRLSFTMTDISCPIEGYCIDKDGSVVAKLSQLNSMIVESTSNRFDIISMMMKQLVSREDICIFELLFIAGNLAHFKYRQRADIVLIISQISSIVAPTKTAVRGFEQILAEGANGKTSSLSIHTERVWRALRLLLLLELKSFLKKMYWINQVEESKFKTNRPYKIRIKSGDTTQFVSNRSKGNPISSEASELRFRPSIGSEKTIQNCERKSCCGRDFSADTLLRLNKKLKTLLTKH